MRHDRQVGDHVVVRGDLRVHDGAVSHGRAQRRLGRLLDLREDRRHRRAGRQLLGKFFSARIRGSFDFWGGVPPEGGRGGAPIWYGGEVPWMVRGDKPPVGWGMSLLWGISPPWGG